MGEILQIRDLKVSYGGIDAVRGISFNVPKGSIMGFIGQNGAGKTTTINTILNIIEPDS